MITYRHRCPVEAQGAGVIAGLSERNRKMENTEQECLREEAERERTIPHDPDPEDGA